MMGAEAQRREVGHRDEASANAHSAAVRLRMDLRRQQWGAWALAGAAIVLAGVLVPRGDELLLIHVRNRNIESARNVLAEQARDGVSNVSSVVAHGELFLLEGRVDEALSELERFVERHPDNAAAWQRLARLYHHAQRLEDETRALAEVYRLVPTDDLARQLVAFSLWTGDESREASLLFGLVGRGAATAEEYARSARLEAALGRPVRAIEVLERGLRTGSTGADYADLELYAGLLVDQGRAPELGLRLQALPVRQRPELLEQLAASLRTWGVGEAAVHLYAPPVPGVPVSPTALVGRARAAVGTPLASSVLQEIVATDTRAPLMDEALAATLDLALSLSRYDIAVDLLTRPGRAVPPNRAAGVLGYAISHGARQQAQMLIARLGDDALADSPLVALELAVERADTLRAKTWVERFDKHPETTPEEQVAVAQLEARMGAPEAAFARVRSVVQAGGAPIWAYADLAMLASVVDREEEAVAILAGTPSQPIAPEQRRAWAGLSMRSGHVARVEDWVRSGSAGGRDVEALRDVVHLATQQQAGQLALEAARQLWSITRASEDALLVGQGLLSAGRPGEAVVVLRQADVSTPGTRLAYDNALLQAQRAGEDVVEELRSVFTARLGDSEVSAEHRQMLVEGLWAVGERAALFEELVELSPRDLDRWLTPLIESAKAAGEEPRAATVIAGADGGLADADLFRRSDRVRALLALDAPDGLLLSELRRLAHEVGDSWVFAYDERLARAGRLDDRVDLWSVRGLAAGTADVERRAAAARLVELGAEAAAARVLEVLADRAGPTDPDVMQLLALWGPRADAAQVRWLVRRMREALPPDQAAWIRHTLAAGGASAVAEAFPNLPLAAPSEVVDAWVDAYRTASPSRLRAALDVVVTRPETAASTLRHVARTALAESLADVAEAAYQRLHSMLPDDGEALRWLGTLAFYRHDLGGARVHLERYVARGGDEAEPLFQLGELARDKRQADDARRLYVQARARLEGMDPSPSTTTLLANVLVRLGDRDGARAAFERVLRVGPENDHVRADYVVALLGWGASAEAWHVLEAHPGALRPVDDAASGAKRLELLRVQWLSAAGHYREALDRLDELARQLPSDPDVRLARANFDADRGHVGEADRQFAAVVADSPGRSDVAAVVREWEQRQAPRASVQVESRSVSEAWTASGTTVAGEARLGRSALSVQLERLFVSAPNVVRADGRMTPLAAELTRWDVGVTARIAAGTTFRSNAFGTTDGLGVGATIRHHDLSGAYTLTVERGRPFWEFVESAADGGRRDRVGLQREWRFGVDTAAWVAADWNTYRLSSGPEARSGALTVGAVRTLRRQTPAIAIQYGLDKEHRLSLTHVTAADGRAVTPIPLSSREVHLAGAIARFPIRQRWDVDATAGYTFDRLGGRGSFLTAHVTPRPTLRTGIEAWAEWRLYALTTTQRAWRSGMRLVVRF